jgi:hypothetical protein
MDTMLIAYWIAASLLAFVYLFAGGMKLIRSREALVAAGMGWATDMNRGLVKLVGLVEVLGALGVILPGLVQQATLLAPTAALGLVLVQGAAIGIHWRRGEAKSLPVNIVLLLLALVVAWLGAIVFTQ